MSRKQKRRKLAMEEDEEEGNNGAVKAAIRSAKKASRPSKIGEPERRPQKAKSKDKKKKTKGKKVTSRVGGVFDRDLGSKASRHEGVRAKKGDAVGGMKPKGRKQKAKRNGS
jgi:ATP-dependent RNA helicase DDX27